jgi:predicted permease
MDIHIWIGTFLQDIRYALRQSLKKPVFTAVVVLSVAVGVGANTAIFSLINSVLLRDLPVRAPGELVMLTSPSRPGWFSGLVENERRQISYPEFVELKQRLTTLSGMFAADSRAREYQVRIADGPQETTRGRLVTEEYFSVLSVEPVIGRVFSSADATGPVQDPYLVISYDFWQNRFGGKTDVLGKPVKLSGAILTVIGVAPAGFRGESGGDAPDFWIPMMMQPAIYPGTNWLHEDPGQSLRKIMWLNAFGRLKPKVTLANVQSEVNVVFRGMIQAFYPATLAPDLKRQALSQYLMVRDARRGAYPGRENLGDQLKILLVIAGLVLLIACANVANLLLERSTARQREVSIRLSIGASQMRLFRQFMTESLFLSVLGGAVGVLIALIASKVLAKLFSDSGHTIEFLAILDWRVLTFTAAVTVLTGLLFGMAPALRASNRNINLNLRIKNSGGINAARRMNLAKSLIIGQVALSLTLIVGAGLFLRTLWNLQSVALGYPKEHLLQVAVDGPAAGYKGPALLNFYRNVTERLQALPGVSGASYSDLGLMTGKESQSRIEVEGYIARSDADRRARYEYISPGYFAVVGVPLILGREFSLRDAETSPKACLINEALAKHFFAGQNPIGRHITVLVKADHIPLEIVGVVKNARSQSLRKEIPERFYVPSSQAFGGEIGSSAIFVIRTRREPETMVSTAQKAILGINQDVPIRLSATLQELIAEQTIDENRIAQLCLTFAILALVLAAIGLYGVLSNGVARRTNEIGIRMAVGADRGKVIRMVLGEASFLVAIGFVMGILAVGVSTRAIVAKLYGLSGTDPLTIAFALILLSGVALIASYIPATRAAGVNPVQALRHE